MENFPELKKSKQTPDQPTLPYLKTPYLRINTRQFRLKNYLTLLKTLFKIVLGEDIFVKYKFWVIKIRNDKTTLHY